MSDGSLVVRHKVRVALELHIHEAGTRLTSRAQSMRDGLLRYQELLWPVARDSPVGVGPRLELDCLRVGCELVTILHGIELVVGTAGSTTLLFVHTAINNKVR